MKHFPEEAKFIYPWRTYQANVLNSLDEYLKDDHLHIIAPPGSGKTVLGLEVMLRLNKAVLIIAPTLAIRNQWIQRFCELFLQVDTAPDWISTNVRNPKFMTVVTYQGLHAACNNKEEFEMESEEEENENTDNLPDKNLFTNTVIQGLKKAGIKTLIADEAHHLKNEWWASLNKIKDALNPTIVGLTATPPYDVTSAEWKRYLDLNGPIDTEISVPELIKENDLCPHQDYVYFTALSKDENEILLKSKMKLHDLYEQLRKDETLCEVLLKQDFWTQPSANLDWLYTNVNIYVACLIFLKDNQIAIPEEHLTLLGDEDATLPNQSQSYISLLINWYLFKEKERFENYTEHQKQILNKIKSKGGLERGVVDLVQDAKLTQLFSSSISKLNAIEAIVNFEYKQLQSNLRMVVLADYIRKEYFVNGDKNDVPLLKLGVMSIFESLRRNNHDQKLIGVLTGSLIIIPKTAFEYLKLKASAVGLSHIVANALSYDENYLSIPINAALKHSIVHLITQVFQDGKIEILIGTKSLLGEGWDAPAINALILASFVGSFVLSNQMRGRAIRTLKNVPDKTANIWHIVCVDQTATLGGPDVATLQRRFKTFVGVSFKENGGIESGMQRLNLEGNLYLEANQQLVNDKMFAYAADRKGLRDRWEKGLTQGVGLVEGIKIPYMPERSYTKEKSIYFKNTIANFVAMLISAIGAYLSWTIESIAKISKNIRSFADLLSIFSVLGLLGLAIFARRGYKALRLYIRYRDIAKDFENIAHTLMHTMEKFNLFRNQKAPMTLIVDRDDYGILYCQVRGANAYMKSIYINALQEIVLPIDNPRYVIIRKNKLNFFIHQRDYHAVPETLARNKQMAEAFAQSWQENIGDCELIFTRTYEGRRLLLKARVNALSAQLEEMPEHINKWR